MVRTTRFENSGTSGAMDGNVITPDRGTLFIEKKKIVEQFEILIISGFTHQTRKLMKALDEDINLKKYLKLAIQRLTP